MALHEYDCYITSSSPCLSTAFLKCTRLIKADELLKTLTKGTDVQFEWLIVSGKSQFDENERSQFCTETHRCVRGDLLINNGAVLIEKVSLARRAPTGEIRRSGRSTTPLRYALPQNPLQSPFWPGAVGILRTRVLHPFGGESPFLTAAISDYEGGKTDLKRGNI